MENKLEYFLELIHMDKKEEFINTKLQRVIVNSKDSIITIFLETTELIEPKLYFELKQKMENYFQSNVEIKINNLGDKSLYLDEYYKMFLPKYITYFQDRLKINGENNNYIVVYNQGELKQVNDYLKEINYHLTNLGFNHLTVYLDEEERVEIQKLIQDNLDNINYEKKKTSFQPDTESKPFEPRRKKVKTVDDPNVYLGEVIAGEVINIKDIVSEDNDLIIECEIFGVDVYESAKTDFKIITLKLTDYTDSMYAKIFTTDTDELTRLLGILKNGKWFKFKGYTKKDKYSMDEIVFNIKDIISKLNEKDRYIYELYFKSLLSQKEIAKKTNISQAYVSRKINKIIDIVETTLENRRLIEKSKTKKKKIGYNKANVL